MHTGELNVCEGNKLINQLQQQQQH